MKTLIDNKDCQGIAAALSAHPDFANEEFAYYDANTAKAHPLQRIADGAFAGKYAEEEAIEMAKLFLAHGANIDGNEPTVKQDTPLIAATSLNIDQLAIFYIEQGANINHQGCFGGTALHWAAWLGRTNIVRKLIQQGAEINKLCIDFKATPVFWAAHGLRNWGSNLPDCLACTKLLLEAGADKNIRNGEGTIIFELLEEEHLELRTLLNAY